MPTQRGTFITQPPSGSGAASIARPTGLQPTDVVVLFVVSDHGGEFNYSASGFTSVVPDGYSDLGLSVANWGVLWGTGFDDSGTFTVTPSDPNAWLHLGCVAFSDADSVVAGVSQASGGSPLAVPAVTTTVDDALVLAVLVNIFGSVASTDPATTELGAIWSSGGWVHTRGVQPTAGSSGALDFTPGINSRSSGGVQIAIQPAAPPPPPEDAFVARYWDSTAEEWAAGQVRRWDSALGEWVTT